MTNNVIDTTLTRQWQCQNSGNEKTMTMKWYINYKNN